MLLTPLALTDVADSTLPGPPAQRWKLRDASAFVPFVTLVGRCRPTRASVSVYFAPVVAVIVGVQVGDSLTLFAGAGRTAVVAGAVMVSWALARRGDPWS